MKFFRWIILIMPVLLLLSSCTRMVFGIRTPLTLSDMDIRRAAISYQIHDTSIYCNKSTKLYYASLLQNNPDLKSLAKDHMQPLQALYFNHEGEMVSWHINCLAGGPLGAINWNKNHVMDVFPPLTAAHPDTLIRFADIYAMLRPLSAEIFPDTADYDYLSVVYWNQFMKRGSRKLVRTVKRNLRLATGLRIKMIWVNNDNDFATSDHLISPAEEQWTEDLLNRK